MVRYLNLIWYMYTIFTHYIYFSLKGFYAEYSIYVTLLIRCIWYEIRLAGNFIFAWLNFITEMLYWNWHWYCVSWIMHWTERCSLIVSCSIWTETQYHFDKWKFYVYIILELFHMNRVRAAVTQARSWCCYRPYQLCVAL